MPRPCKAPPRTTQPSVRLICCGGPADAATPAGPATTHPRPARSRKTRPGTRRGLAGSARRGSHTATPGWLADRTHGNRRAKVSFDPPPQAARSPERRFRRVGSVRGGTASADSSAGNCHAPAPSIVDRWCPGIGVGPAIGSWCRCHVGSVSEPDQTLGRPVVDQGVTRDERCLAEVVTGDLAVAAEPERPHEGAADGAPPALGFRHVATVRRLRAAGWGNGLTATRPDPPRRGLCHPATAGSAVMSASAPLSVAVRRPAMATQVRTSAEIQATSSMAM